MFFLNERRHHKILVVGRPGIGKTVLTKKILHQLITSGDEFWNEKLVILLRFRTFNAEQNKSTTLKNMLSFGEGLPTGGDFDYLYEYILSNSEKVIVIFDGLDAGIKIKIFYKDTLCLPHEWRMRENLVPKAQYL